jgi:hypothetical protein
MRVAVVDQPVKDAIGQCRITDLLVPARDKDLRGEAGREHLVAVFLVARLPEEARRGSSSGSTSRVDNGTATVNAAALGSFAQVEIPFE